MSRKRKSRHVVDAPAVDEDLSTGVPTEEVLAEGSEEIEAAIVEAVEALADDEPLPEMAAAGADDAEVVEARDAADADDAPGEAGEPMMAAAGEGEGEGEGEVAGDAEEAGGAELPTSAGTMDPVQLKQLIEALIFASDKPLTVQRLRQLTRVSDIKRLEATLAEIASDYENRGLILSSVSGGYQFRTRPQFSSWVQQLIAGRPVRLSRAQLETLAIVAYRQPITRPEIDDIRGVDSSATLKLLMDRALIRVLGKKEEVGRPMLYGTTKEFLDFFSLGDLRELPTLREYSELTAESRQVISDRLGIAPDGSDPSDGGGSDGGGSEGGGSEGGPMGDGGPMGGGGSPGDDAGTLLDASADDLREAAQHAADAVSAADADADADAVFAADADADPDADADAVSAADAELGASGDVSAETRPARDAHDDALSEETDDERAADARSDADAEALSAGAADATEDVSAETRPARDADDGALSADAVDERTADARSDADAEALSAGAADATEDVSAETRPARDADDGALSLDAVDELAADELHADTEDSSDDAARDDDGLRLADGTGAVQSADLDEAGAAGDAGEADEGEMFAEGSSQFAAVTDEQLAEALADSIEPAVDGAGAAEAKTMLAAEDAEDPDLRESREQGE